MRVDMYVSALFSDFSRSYVQKIIDNNQLRVNGKVVNKNLKIQNRDVIEIEIQNETLDIEPQDMQLVIIYEDTNIIIINKDPHINVHPVPGVGGNINTLVNGLLFHSQKQSENNIFSKKYELSINGVVRPGIVHRLDKDTSGIMLVAKNDAMMQYLSSIIKERKIEKTYLAVVDGIVTEKELKIESYIGRDPNDRKKMTAHNPLNPKYALSQAKVLRYIDEKYTLLEVQIHTGRTHQIRVQLSSIGYPIVGDSVYGREKVNKEVAKNYGLERQALHAWKLKFELYGKQVEFEAELKKDMKNMIGE